MTIKVKSTGPNDDRAILWERHPDHPGGEVFIVANGKTHEVAQTARIQSRLNDGRLVEVKAVSVAKPATRIKSDS